VELEGIIMLEEYPQHVEPGRYTLGAERYSYEAFVNADMVTACSIEY
jgi:hypothetical protein